MRTDQEYYENGEADESMLDQMLTMWSETNRLSVGETRAILDAVVSAGPDMLLFGKKWWKACFWSGAATVKTAAVYVPIAKNTWQLALTKG